MTIKGPDTSSMDYKYGIFARIASGGSGSSTFVSIPSCSCWFTC